MNVLITLTTAGVDTGPFNLYSNTDSYTTAFQTSVAKSLLVAGYTSTVVPAGTTTIRVKSTGTCTNYVDLVISGGGTTTTTTSTALKKKVNVEKEHSKSMLQHVKNIRSEKQLNQMLGTLYIHLMDGWMDA